MKQYWARHEGRNRWGVRTPLEIGDEFYKTDAGIVFVWSDKVVLDRDTLVFVNDDGEIRGALAAGRWDAVFEANPDDSPQTVETRD
jgi:hypothetical protein